MYKKIILVNNTIKIKGGIILKRLIIFLIMLLIFLASIGIGYFYLNTRDDQKNASKSEDLIAENNIENQTISTENQEEKISPNAKITTTIFYKKCGHEIIEEKEVDKELVNLTKKELEKTYEDYEIENFSELQISLYKEENGFCDEHYYIGENDGSICIYKLNKEGEEELYESTNILIEYLPEEEKKEIESKKEIIGKEELYSILENFES